MTSAGSYEGHLVALSVVIAVLASHTALELALGIRSARPRSPTAVLRLVAAAAALGAGIWATALTTALSAGHDRAAASDPSLSVVAFLVGAVASGTAFRMALAPGPRWWRTAIAGMVFGLGLTGAVLLGAGFLGAGTTPGIAGAGMVTGELDATMRRVAVGLFAMAASAAALRIGFRDVGAGGRIVGSLGLGLVVAGAVHALAGRPIFAMMPAAVATELPSTGLAAGLAIASAFVLALTLADRRLAATRAGETEALRDSEHRFRLLVDGVSEYAIFMLDPQGRLTNWNSGAHRIKGYTAEEIVGRHFSAFYTEEDRAAGVPERALAVAEREGKFEAEGWRVRKDGGRFWASVTISAIRDDAGRLIGFAKVTRDTTERREAQHKLEEARQQLAQAQKMEAIGQLTGGIAHDFNNLLAVVIGNLDLLRKRVPDEPRLVHLVETAIKGAERGAALTQRMLSFARRQDLKPAPVDVPALVRGMADLLQRSIGPSIGIETRFPLHLPRARVDANQLELALVNLAVNARDAMPEGGTMTVSASAETVAPGSEADLAPGPYVRLAVTDTGQGMEPEVLERAMEPFFTTKGIGKGTGLGLSMVHGLAAQSGGRLLLASAPGQGTTAEIWLPVDEAATEAERQAATAIELAREPGAARRLRLLVVDDDGLVLMATAAMLEDLGHDVVEAMSGREALERFERDGPFDLILTDEAMPGMTGTQLAEVIRRTRPDLPVLLGTGYAELPRGADKALPRITKPFDQDTLARAIGRLLAGEPAAGKQVLS